MPDETPELVPKATPVARSGSGDARSPKKVVANLKVRFSIEQAARQEFNRQTAIRVDDHVKRRAMASSAFAKFTASRVGESVRRSETYLSPTDDLDALQANVTSADLRTAARVHKLGATFTLTDQELEGVGLARDESGSVHGEFDPVRARALLSPLLEFIGTVNAWDPVAECRASLQADRALASVTENAGPGGPAEHGEGGTGNPNAPVGPSADTVVTDGVVRQVATASSPEGALVFGVPRDRATPGDVRDATTSFELRGGPADVTAYHDFHDLQIAFRPVWTELFDDDLADLGRRMYEELVELKGKGWGSETFEANGSDEITTADELRELRDELIRARLAVASNDTRYVEVHKLVPDLTAELWASMDEGTRQALYELVPDWLTGGVSGVDSWTEMLSLPATLALAQATAQAIVQAARVAMQAKPAKKRRVTAFLDELEEHLREEHAFSVFAPGSANFGILVTYRQAWAPLSYQVGELVSTIPLAPKEIRRFSTKRVIRKSRAVKEIENALRIRKEESQDTSRDHAEIVERASDRTNFKVNAEGGVNFLVWNAKGSHSIATDSARQSASVKKEFREAVLRAAEEYRAEHRMEISSQSAEDLELTTSGEISNPNDEIPVTYLFFELERRYEISEKIHRLTPVVLVANAVPRPHEIDEDWLLAHDWILRRAILDDSFLPALTYLSESYVSDELAIEVLRTAFEAQLDVVSDVKEQVSSHAKTLSYVRAAMDTAIDRYAQSLTEESGGLFGAIGDFLFGGETEDTETRRVRMDAAKESFQRAERQERDLRSRLASEVTALSDATRTYADALGKQLGKRTEILRLRAHVKDNILYYMHAIWDLEPPDQRFFRLHELPIVDLHGFEFEPSPTPGWVIDEGGAKTTMNFLIHPVTTNEKRTLAELADLDNLLGYKGNYMIFPLKQSNSVTTFMMQDYLDLRTGTAIVDPDEAGNMTVDDLLALLRCMEARFPGHLTDQLHAKYRDLIIKRLTDPTREKEVVVVPSGSLYIEALAGVHPILEDFKLIHRAVDVKKAQSEVRHDELENLRMAARVLSHEYSDPDVDRMVVIEGPDGPNPSVPTGSPPEP